MVSNPLTSARRWFDRTVRNRSELDRLSAWELEKQSDRIARSREEHKTRMDEVKDAYEAKVEEASTADGHELQELKVEASFLLERYERLRRQWAGMLQTQRWLQQLILGKNADETGVPDVMAELGVDPDRVENIGQQVEEAVDADEERIGELGWQADKIQEAHRGGEQAMRSLSDDRVDQAIDAVREGDGVPEIDSLVDESSVDIDGHAIDDSNEVL